MTLSGMWQSSTGHNIAGTMMIADALVLESRKS